MSSTIKRLILASQSPFRRALLQSTGLAFEAETAPIDENKVLGRIPKELAERRSLAKAMAVAALHPEALVIGADQVLSLDGDAFDKVKTAQDAVERLQSMAGRTHYLHSGLALVYAARDQEPKVLASEVVDVPMRMRKLSLAEINAYVRTQEWQGSVGCYQYENRGIHLFEGSVPGGDQSTIVGLPLGRLLHLLRVLGVNCLVQASPPWSLVPPRLD